MTKRRRVKISVSLPADLVESIDREAARQEGETRSGVMEAWLRQINRQEAQAKYDEEVRAYYSSLTPEEIAHDRIESEAWSKAGMNTWIERERREEAEAKRRERQRAGGLRRTQATKAKARGGRH